MKLTKDEEILAELGDELFKKIIECRKAIEEAEKDLRKKQKKKLMKKKKKFYERLIQWEKQLIGEMRIMKNETN